MVRARGSGPATDAPGRPHEAAMTVRGEPDSLFPDTLFNGRLRLFQPARGAHRAGTDAVLLARLFDPAPGATLCDAGAGTGVVGLAYALRTGARVTLVEREPELAALARRNVALNAVPDTIVTEADLLAPAQARQAAGLVPEAADIVVTNPPFLGPGHRPSPHALRAVAHSLPEVGLAAWIRTCTWLLRPGGRLGLIHRADALPDCLGALAGRFGDVAVRPVHARPDRPAIRILIRAVKGSRAGTSLLPPLVLQQDDGRTTTESDRIHSGIDWN